MSLREVIFYRRGTLPQKNFAGAERGTFHEWGTWEGLSIGIIEDIAGQVVMTYPEYIKFIDK